MVWPNLVNIALPLAFDTVGDDEVVVFCILSPLGGFRPSYIYLGGGVPVGGGGTVGDGGGQAGD